MTEKKNKRLIIVTAVEKLAGSFFLVHTSSVPSARGVVVVMSDWGPPSPGFLYVEQLTTTTPQSTIRHTAAYKAIPKDEQIFSKLS